jgi:UTP--glucose-1-phosphate uridylyltransferase
MVDISTVFIPAAGRGSRLGGITDHLPKPLIGVRRKPAISHVIDLYPATARFVVAVGYKGDLLSEFLRAAYPAREIVIVEIANHTGPGSGLGTTISESAPFLDEPFVFHAVDTLVTDPWWTRLRPGRAALVVADHPRFPGLYRRTRIDAAAARCLELTEPTTSSPAGFSTYIGVSWIDDPGHFAAWARTTGGERGESGYLRGVIPRGLAVVQAGDWHDLGSPAGLAAARESLEDVSTATSQKLREATFDCGATIVKVHSSEGVAQLKLKRAEAMGRSAVPRHVRASQHCLWYEKAPGEPLARRDDKMRYLPGLLTWLHEAFWTPDSTAGRPDTERMRRACDRFYRSATVDRLEELPSELLDEQVSEIDGVPVAGSLRDVVAAMPWTRLQDGKAVRWHGDLHSENIIVTPDEDFVLIDWRDTFGDLEPPYGDLYYELGKLMHGFVLPDAVIESARFTVDRSRSASGTVVATCYARSADDRECLRILAAQVRCWGLSWRRVQLVCGLVFLRMSPLYRGHDIAELLWAVGLREVSAAIHDSDQDGWLT